MWLFKFEASNTHSVGYEKRFVKSLDSVQEPQLTLFTPVSQFGLMKYQRLRFADQETEAKVVSYTAGK